VAIAYGYNNIVKTTPKTLTVAQQLPINKLTDQLREAVAQVGINRTLLKGCSGRRKIPKVNCM
jgi:phenylalanyl-tRNA synthetase beta chain